MAFVFSLIVDIESAGNVFCPGVISPNSLRSRDILCHYLQSGKNEGRQFLNPITTIDSPFKCSLF